MTRRSGSLRRAVLDTCVLVPSLQRDFLLQLAAEEAYLPVWGSGILVELDYVLAGLHDRRRVTDSAIRRHRLFTQLKEAFPGSDVHAPKDGEYEYGLSDADDGHVLHAAITGNADVIVTDDRRAGFGTAHALVKAGIETLSPHQFALDTVAAHPQAGLDALRQMSNRRIKPTQTPEQILQLLVTRHQMAEMAQVLMSQ